MRALLNSLINNEFWLKNMAVAILIITSKKRLMIEVIVMRVTISIKMSERVAVYRKKSICQHILCNENEILPNFLIKNEKWKIFC